MMEIIGEGKGNSMKLLMISHFFDSHRGGLEVVAERLARELSGRGLHVTWIASDNTAVPAESEVGYRVVGVPALNFLECLTGIAWPVPTLRAAVRIWREVRS